MGLQRLEWDEWEGAVYEERKVLNPTWEQTEAAIRKLDADRRTIVCLVADDGRQLLIGGGAGQFVMTVGIDEDRHLTAKADSKPRGNIELTVGGQTGIYCNEMVWDLDAVLKSAKLFWRDNSLDPSLAWS